jgi:hypothetical protein
MRGSNNSSLESRQLSQAFEFDGSKKLSAKRWRSKDVMQHVGVTIPDIPCLIATRMITKTIKIYVNDEQ